MSGSWRILAQAGFALLAFLLGFVSLFFHHNHIKMKVANSVWIQKVRVPASFWTGDA